MRSTQIGVLGTILVHLLLFLLAPHILQLDHAALRPPRAAPPQQFNVELMPEVEMPKPVQAQKPPMKFVEVNPDAPDNVPDKTNNTGAQNQQAAQEKPTPDQSGDRPALEGQTKIKTDQIVSGSLAPPVPPRPSGAQQQPMPPQKPAAQMKREQTPLSGFEKFKGDTEDSYGSNIAKLSDHADKVDKAVEGKKNAPMEGTASNFMPQINPLKPQPRPRLEQRARPAIFTENKIGTSNIGPIAVDARWSNYAQYLQQLIETVQIQWERILTQSQVYPASGSTVTVTFILNKAGEISRIVHVDGTAGDQGRRACVSAITMRAPYGDWTDDMVAVLGDQQEMTFRFYYQ